MTLFTGSVDQRPEVLEEAIDDIKLRHRSSLFQVDVEVNPLRMLESIAPSFQMVETRHAGVVLAGEDVLAHYPPDVGALSYRLKHLAETLAEDYEVTVLTAQPNRYEGATKAPAIERQENLTIRRISSVQLLKSRGKVGRRFGELFGQRWVARGGGRECDGAGGGGGGFSLDHMFYLIS